MHVCARLRACVHVCVCARVRVRWQLAIATLGMLLDG